MRLASVSYVPGCAVLALLLGLAPSAKAADAGAAASAPAAAAPLTLFVERNGQSFDVEELREALRRELGRDVELGQDARAASVHVRLESASRAQVRYTTPRGEALHRAVELPLDRERSVQVVSWLTVNLVRDEASELIEQLRARRKEEEARALAEKQAAEAQAAAEQAAADKAAADRAAADRAARQQARPKEPIRRLPPAAPRPPLLRDLSRSFDLALATPISTVPDSPKRVLRLQLALAYGDMGGLEGVAITTSVLRVRRDLWGAAAALGACLVGGNARGVLASVGYAHVEGNLEGALLGVGAAVQRGKSTRGAVAGVGGAIAGDVDGAIAAAGIASARSLVGVGVAGGITVTRGPSRGVLVAGGVNFSGDLRGVEAAGGINIARDLQGFALAPLNVHRRVKGVQVGVVNIAEEVDGAQIGVLSLSKTGRFQPTFWGSSDGSVHLGLKSISGHAFTQLGGGINLDASQASYDGAIGAHLELSAAWFVEPGVHYSGVQRTDAASTGVQQHRLHYLGVVGLRIGRKLDLLAGGGVRHTIAGDAGLAPELRAGIAFF